MDNEICFRKFIESIMTIFLAISIANIGVNIIVSTQSDVNSDTNTSESANIMTEEKDLTLSELLVTKAEEKLESLESQIQAESKDMNTDEAQNADDSSDRYTVFDAISIFLLFLIPMLYMMN